MKPGPAISTSTTLLSGRYFTIASAMARELVGELGGFQRHGGGPLAVRGVRRSLDATIFQLECGQVAGLLGGGESGANQLFIFSDCKFPP